MRKLTFRLPRPRTVAAAAGAPLLLYPVMWSGRVDRYLPALVTCCLLLLLRRREEPHDRCLAPRGGKWCEDLRDRVRPPRAGQQRRQHERRLVLHTHLL